MPFDPRTAPTRLHFTNPLGHSLDVEVRGLDEMYEAAAYYGGLGWTCGTLPPGGILMPLLMFPVFNFALIGASAPRVLQDPGGVKLAVRHQGQVYRHRFMAANRDRKLPAKLLFSRIAGGGDDAEEQVTSRPPMVPLISFRGGGRITSALLPYCLPNTVGEDGLVIRAVHALPGHEGRFYEAASADLEDHLRSLPPEAA